MSYTLSENDLFGGRIQMKQAKQFNIGDTLVRFSNLYTITDIKERKSEDKIEKIIIFEPLHKNQRNETLICSIPASSVSKANIRRPLSKDEVGALFNELSESTVEPISYKHNLIQKYLNENEASQLVKILKNLWIEKTDKVRSFTPTKKHMYQAALKKLTQEIAFVMDITLEEAQKLVVDTLEKTGEYQLQQT